MTKDTTPPAEETTLAKIEQADSLAFFNHMLEGLPTLDDDPTASMIAAILAAPDPAAWEEVFSAASFKDSATRHCRVHTLRASPSQFPSGPAFFLILDVTWLPSGEKGVITCGSTMAMAQLVNAWRTNSLPVDVEIFRRPTPTRSGFYPMRLKYLGRNGGPLGDPDLVVSEQ